MSTPNAPSSGPADRVATRVTRVIVYRNGALVVRAGRAAPGPVTVAGLPLLFSSESLRLRPDAGTVRDLRELCRLESAPADGALSEHAEALAQNEFALAEVEDALRAVANRVALFEGCAPEPVPDRQRWHVPPAEALLALHGVVSDRLDGLEARRGELLHRRRDLQREARALQRIVQRDPEPPRFSRGVRFTLTDADEPVGFELEYFVAAARWVPSYALDVSGVEATLRLDALIAQASGEDWEDAEIRVATADLTRDCTLPAVTSWRIGPRQAQPRPAFRPLPTDLADLFTGYDTASPPGRAAPPRPVAAAEPGPVAHPAPRVASAVVEDTGRFDLDDEVMALADEEAEEVWEPPPRNAPSSSMTRAGRMAPPPAPQVPPPMSAPEAPMMKSRASFGASGGAAPEQVAIGGSVAPPTDAGPRRLRYAYLRLCGPTEATRGTLQPVDPLSHLWSLLEGHAAAAPDALWRATNALHEAAGRLYAAPLPTGARTPDLDGFHHVYVAEGRHEVPGDGFWHRIGVHTRTTPARAELRAVPRQSRDCYRFCVVETDGDVPYPAGPLHVHQDGVFRVTAALEASGGGRPLELNLGVEPAVRIVDRTARAHQEDKGLMSQTTRVDHTVIVRVRSSLDAPMPLVLYDRLPVPRLNQKDIEVTLLASTPEAERIDRGPHDEPLEGGLRWTLTLPPNAAPTVEYQYRVAFPAKLELSGGNRRD